MFSKHKLGVIGAGNMGEALIRGALNAGLLQPANIVAADPRAERLHELESQLGIATTTDNNALLGDCNLILIAVKPQVLGALWAECAFADHHVVLSVVAGATTRAIEAGVGKPLAVVRVMPNTPALVGQGMSVFCLGRHADREHADVAAALFGSVGLCKEVPEQWLDPVTAVSGSGPAYVFLLAEAMQAGAESLGLPADLSAELIQQTLVGAAALLQQSDVSAAALRQRVTSPGGTTAAAIGVLEDGRFRELMEAALHAARQRAADLGS
jgi:pyrroline-5-carboxylate reductase